MSNLIASLLISFNAVMPVVALLAIGFFLKRKGIVSMPFEMEANNLVYRWALPLYLFNAARKVDLAAGLNLPMLLYGMAVPMIICITLALVLPRFYGDNRRRIGAFICVAVTSGCAIPGLALSNALLPGDTGSAFVLSVPIWVMTNVLVCTLALTVYAESRIGFAGTLRLLGRQTLRTPIVWGVLAGIGVNVLSVPVPDFLSSVIGYLSELTTPLALITLGAGLRFDIFKKEFKQYFTGGVLIRLILVSLVFLPLAWLLGFRGSEITALFLHTATPMGPGAYSIAVALKSDSEFVGQSMVVAQVFSCLTIFIGIVFLIFLGFI